MYFLICATNIKYGGDILQYKNLNELICKSSSSRKYFLSLPVSIQIELHKYNEYIHSANQLHIKADMVRLNLHAIENCNSLFNRN